MPKIMHGHTHNCLCTHFSFRMVESGSKLSPRKIDILAKLGELTFVILLEAAFQRRMSTEYDPLRTATKRNKT